MADKQHKACPICGGKSGFKDLPADYADKRWPGHVLTDEHLVRTQCKDCGATVPTVAIHESVREGAD